MKRIDLRQGQATLPNLLQEIADRAHDSDTRPHGLKVLEVGEGLGVPTSTGLQILGPEWAESLDRGIAAASDEVSEAAERLEAAEVELEAARGRIDETTVLLEQLDEQAGQTAEEVAGVIEGMAADRARLDAAEQELSGLAPRVGDVEGAVSASDAKAAQAVSDAARALQEAQQAREYAEGLDPSTGDGSYAEAMQAAQAAARDALAAMERANQAMTSASGKSSVRNATSAPQGVGTAVGDTWFQWTAFPAGTVTGQWTWDGSAWRLVTMSHQVQSSMDLGKATVGELDGLRIKAGSVEASRMTIGVGSNALADPFFTDAALRERRSAASTGAWSYGADNGRPYMALTTAVTSTQTFRYAPLGTAGLIPTVAGRQWRIEVPMYLSSGRARVNVRWYNAQGAAFSYAAAGDYVSGPGEVRVVGEVTAPSDAVGFLIDLYMPLETTGRTAKVYGGASASVKSGSVHIEDGAVTASKVNAESVAGVIGQFVKVQAQNVEVTDTLAARVLSAARAEVAEAFVTDRLVVGTGDDRTVLEVLGTAVVNDLNYRGTLRGRDAILDGTLDVEQLNVTEDMTAELAKFMTTETRDLIVTGDASITRATFIEGIATPLVEAAEGRFNNLLATKASISAIEAGNLTLTGHFRSGAAGKPGVIIPQNYTTQAGFQQLGIWLAPTGVAPSLGSEWGSTAGIWLDEAANVAGTGARSRLHIRGQSGAGVDVYGQLTVHKYPGSDSSVITAANGADLFVMAKDGNKSILYSRDNGAIVNATGTGDASLRASGSGHVFVRNSGTGTVVVRSEENAIWVTSATNDVNVQAKNLLRLRSDDRIAMQKSGGDGGYDYTGSTGSKVDLTIHPASGVVNLKTSARRFKTDIQPFTPDPRWLDQPVVSYLNKQAVERWEEIVSDPTYGPLTQDDYLVLKEAMTREVGTIADDAADYGAGDLVAYDADGEVLAWDYARETVVLRHFLREHRDKIAALEARLEALGGAA